MLSQWRDDSGVPMELRFAVAYLRIICKWLMDLMNHGSLIR